MLAWPSAPPALADLRTWFVLDFVASFPLDWTLSGVSFVAPPGIALSPNPSPSVAAAGPVAVAAAFADATDLNKNVVTQQLPSMLRLFKLIKLMRLLRVARLLKHMKAIESRLVSVMDHNSLRLLHILIALVVFSHCMTG